MKRFMKFTSVVALIGLGATSYAQQVPYSNLYEKNLYSINPAYAGASGCTEIYFSHLNQWVKVDGAPLTSFFSANTRIGKSLGLGGNLLVDKIGMLQQVAGNLSLSYGFTIAQEHKIRVGVSGGYFQMRVDPTTAIAFDAGDEIIDNGQQSQSTVYTDAGLSYQWKDLDVSFSSKQMLELFTRGNYVNATGYGLRRHLLGYTGYRFAVGQNFGIKPNVFYRGIGNANQFDFNIDADYRQFVYIGMGYRTDVGIVARIGGRIRDMFYAGYAYEIPLNNIASYGSGSHEFMIGLKLCKREKPGMPPEVVESKMDTIRVVEYQTDTVIVERVDTVVIEKVTKEEAERVIKLAAQNLEFEYDKSIIVKNSFADLDALTNLMLMREDLKIKLEGHTDNNGSEEYNMQLSKNRVEAVKAYLVANGIEKDRVQIAYFGESKPIADNSTPEGQAKNRRVEMTYIE